MIEFFVQEPAGNGITAVIGGETTSEFQGKMLANYILANSDNESMEIGTVNAKGFETVTATVGNGRKGDRRRMRRLQFKRLEAPLTSSAKTCRSGYELPHRQPRHRMDDGRLQRHGHRPADRAQGRRHRRRQAGDGQHQHGGRAVPGER